MGEEKIREGKGREGKGREEERKKEDRRRETTTKKGGLWPAPQRGAACGRHPLSKTLCGCVAICLCGYVAMWPYRYVAMFQKVPKYSIRHYRYQVLPNVLKFQMSKFRNSKGEKFQISKLSTRPKWKFHVLTIGGTRFLNFPDLRFSDVQKEICSNRFGIWSCECSSTLAWSSGANVPKHVDIRKLPNMQWIRRRRHNHF